MTDRRIIKTQKAIIDTFILLLKTKPLNKITVSEISKQADLGRGTFYLHYKDVYDLYDSLEKSVFNELFNIFDSNFPSTKKAQRDNLINELVTYIYSEKELFTLLINTEPNGKSLSQLRNLFYEKVLWEIPELYTSEYDVIESMFIVSGIIGIFEHWISTDCKISKTDINNMISKVLDNFLE